MKKLTIFLLTVFLAVTAVTAVDIEVSADSSNFYLFDRYGAAVDVYYPQIEEGLIVMTKDEWLKLDCQYGTVSMAPSSLLTVLSFDPEHPILYLVAGEASFAPKADFYLEVYTPTTLVSTGTKGEFYITTTEDIELVLNLDGGELRVLNGLDGSVTTLPALTWANNVTGGTGPVSRDEYYIFSRIGDRVFEEPAELEIPEFATEDPEKEDMTASVPLAVIEDIAKTTVPAAEIEDIATRTVPAAEIEDIAKPGAETKVSETGEPVVPTAPEIIITANLVPVTVPTAPTFIEGESIPLAVIEDIAEPIVPSVPSAPSVSVAASSTAEAATVPEAAELTADAVLAETEETAVPESAEIDTDAVLTETEDGAVPTAPQGLEVTGTVLSVTAPSITVTQGLRDFEGEIPEYPVVVASSPVKVPSAPTFITDDLIAASEIVPADADTSEVQNIGAYGETPDGVLVPKAPYVTVKDFAIRLPAVPTTPIFFSTKSVPSHQVPDMPVLAVKSITHIVPIAPPFVIVYDDKPGFTDYTAPTIKPRGSAKSEKKTNPTPTSSSR